MENIKELKPIDILLVDDNPGDIRLTQEAFEEGRMGNNLTVVKDGEEALSYLRREGVYSNVVRPDLILLDLNLPKKDGREVLAEIKGDEQLKKIPVIVLTTSEAEQDVLNTYNLHVNCYIKKPVDLDRFINVVKGIEDFWFEIATLPRSNENG